MRRREIARTVAVVAQETDAASAGMPMTVADLTMLGRLPHQSFESRSGERGTGRSSKTHWTRWG